jgi:hypothetical protein
MDDNHKFDLGLRQLLDRLAQDTAFVRLEVRDGESAVEVFYHDRASERIPNRKIIDDAVVT